MSPRIFRTVATFTVLPATIYIFAYYLIKHPAIRHALQQVSPAVLLLLLLLYFGTVFALTLINLSTLKLCRLSLPLPELLLLTAYSAVINFFGPLQSGPAFRAVYLKKKYNLNLKKYAAATLVYYVFYGVFSCLFLLSGLLRWWLVLFIAVLVVIVYLAQKQLKVKAYLAMLNLKEAGLLAGATLLQVCLTLAIYFTELRAIMPSVHFWQAIVYTGAANLALYVSLTPGAIGFRETFLVFSRRLHHLTNSVIVAANILDRAVYVVLLVILAVFIFGSHARQQLKRVAGEA